MSKKLQIELSAEAENQDVETRWGALLRETRIKRGMSIDDVCSTLHLELKLIDAIETEQQERLPPTSFVRGYLRSYARLLEIDAEPVIQAYSRVCGEDASVITTVVQVKEVSSKDAGPRYASWLVAVILIISLVVWWRAEVLLPSAVKNDVVEDMAESVSETVVIDSPVPDAIAVPEVQQPKAKQVEEKQAELEQSEEAVLPVVADPEPVAPEPERNSKTLSTLVMSFADDSWVEVSDAQGKRLYMDIAKAGQSKTVAGEPPFKILFGNAPAVTLEYNGEIYDHSKHNKKGVARFSLGE